MSLKKDNIKPEEMLDELEKSQRTGEFEVEKYVGIYTIVNTLNLLIEGINWKNLGSKIATGINGLFNEVNWNNVGRLFANKINVPFQMLEGAVNTLNWVKVRIFAEIGSRNRVIK